MASFQVSLGSTWSDYAPNENSLLKTVFLAGAPLCKLSLKGTAYECDFKRMVQKNLTSGRERKIRPPLGLKPSAAEPTSKAIPGGVASVTVPLNHISNLGNSNKEKIAAAAVVPEGNNPVITGVIVDGDDKKKAWTTKKKVVAGAAAGVLGAGAVGGAIAGAYAAGRDAADGDAPSGADHCHDGSYYVPPGCDGPYYVAPGCDGPYYVPPVCDGPYYVPPVCDGPYYVPPVCDGSYYVPPPSPPVSCEPVPVPPPVESACGVPGEDYAEPCEPCCEDGFDAGDAGGFEDGADLDAESGEAVADLITCMF